MQFQCAHAIDFYLLFQQLDGVVFFLVAYFMMKRDAYIHAIDVFGKVEQVNFQLVTYAIDRRTFADVGDTSDLTELGRTQGQRIHATDRYRRAFQPYICSWKPNRSAALVTVCHSPTDTVGPAEHVFSIQQAVLHQGFSDTGAADEDIIYAVGG